MADKRITELQQLTAASLQPALDVLAVADVSAAETKKITPVDLVNTALPTVPDGSIPGDKIVDNSITSLQLAPNSVTSRELADNAVDTAAIQDDAVTNAKIAANAVGTPQLQDNSVTRAKLADNAVGSSEIADRSITASKLVLNTLTAAEIAPNAIGASELANNAVDNAAMASDAIGTAELINNSVTNAKMADAAIGTAELKDNSVTNSKLANDAVSSTELADNSVNSNHIVDGAVDDDHLASGINGAKLTNGTVAGAALVANSVTAAQIAPNAVGASELANNAVDTAALADAAVTTGKLADNSVTNAKLADNAVGSAELVDDSVNSNHIVDGAVDNVHLASGIDGAKLIDGSVSNSHLASGINGAKLIAKSVPNTAIADNSLTADQIAPNSIGASELANNSVNSSAIVNDAVSTPKLQDASVTELKLANGAVTTNKIADGAVTVNKLADGAVTDGKIDGIGLDKLPDAGSATVLAGPVTGAAASPTYRKLEPTDIPTASATTKGGVSVPVSGGLVADGAGAVGIGNSVTPNEFPVISYNEHGLVTNGRALSNSDLPPPALGEIGGVKAGDGITITPDGTISQSLTGVAADTYAKVTVDEMGSVTAGAELVADDIPQIPWDKIENPVITPSELSDKSVQMRHLADYSIAFIQEQQPSVDSTVHIGTFWFKESTASLSQWNGNSWMSVGIGRLSAENLRYCGVFDADLNQITGLTQFGLSEGFVIGERIPDATDPATGVYFVCEIAGSNVTVVPGTGFDPGDWCLCNGLAAGWVRIDTMVGGGGGGGGAARLDDLLDVSVSLATDGAFLQLASDGQWKDVYSIDAGVF